MGPLEAYEWVEWASDGIKLRAKIRRDGQVSPGEDLIDAIEEIEWVGGIPGSPIIPFEMDEATKDWLRDRINDLRDAAEAKCAAQSETGLPPGVGYDCPNNPDGGSDPGYPGGGGGPDVPSPLGGLPDALRRAAGLSSPIILDLDGDGIEAVGLHSGAFFDHDGDRFAEATGWVGSDDGLLVWDRNGNGLIDDGGELFGNSTQLGNGLKAPDGFAALAELDDNGDGRIDSADAAYAHLRVWKDENGNGYTGTEELMTLVDVGVAAINTDHTASDFVDVHGNAHRQIGSFIRNDGTNGDAVDVWFAVDRISSIALDRVEIPEDIAALPLLPGFGTVTDLHQSMARDPGGRLQTLVERFAAEDNVMQRSIIMEHILLEWTGVSQDSAECYVDGTLNLDQNVSVTMRLGALHALIGEEIPVNAIGGNKSKAIKEPLIN